MAGWAGLAASGAKPHPGAGWVALAIGVVVLIVCILGFGLSEVLRVVGITILVVVGIWIAVEVFNDDERCTGPAYDSTAYCYDPSP